MVLRLFNTLTREKEEFRSVHAGEARLYHCGPTVYNYAHIGNLRAYVFADILRRMFEYNGYTVKQVMNITDVGEPISDESEDKMAKGLRREGKPLTLDAMNELGAFYAKAFVDDLRALNIKIPQEMPRASTHIKEDNELVQILLEKGIAYKTGDGIYFDISQFPAYGTRGGFKLGDLKEGARVGVNEQKRSPRDFALWKFSGGAIGWESPFGRGFPGWHLECSAMSKKYLGQPFDIHTGGIDHIPAHHQNEIAQSEAAYGVPLANYWMHSEFVNIAGGEKMAKSEENFLTLRALAKKGIHPLSYRYYLLQTHYRSPLAFSWKALIAAQTAYFKLLAAFSRMQKNTVPAAAVDEINDDLNTPTLIAKLWKFVKEENRNAILDADKILGLDIEHQSQRITEEAKTVPEKIKEIAARREAARLAKDFARADALRAEILSTGYEILDTDSGPIVRKQIK